MEDLEKVKNKQQQRQNSNHTQPPHRDNVHRQPQHNASRGFTQQPQQPQRQQQRSFYASDRSGSRQQQQQRFLPQQQQQRFQQQRLPQQQQHTTHQTQQPPNDGSINLVSHPRTSPPPGTPRAPNGMEHDRQNRDTLICLRCRVMNSHKANTCPYRKYCSSCTTEGHTDYEHMVAQNINAGGQNAHGQNPSAPARGGEQFNE